MAGFRIQTQNREIQPFGKTTKAKRKDAYREFVSSLPCVITGAIGVQVAHLSTAKPEWGHFGRGKGQKVSDRWVLPLTPRCHELQHRGSEMDFWRTHHINAHLACLVLHGLWSDYGDDAHEHCVKLIYSKPWSTT